MPISEILNDIHLLIRDIFKSIKISLLFIHKPIKLSWQSKPNVLEIAVSVLCDQIKNILR